MPGPSSGSAPSSAANASNAGASPTISWVLSSRQETVAFSSVSSERPHAAGPARELVRGLLGGRALLEHTGAGLDVDAREQRDGRAAAVGEREAAREEAAEVEPAAAVEAVAAAQERRVTRDVPAGAPERDGPDVGERADVALDRSELHMCVHRHEPRGA